MSNYAYGEKMNVKNNDQENQNRKYTTSINHNQVELNIEILEAIISVLPGTLNVIDRDYNVLTVNENELKLKLAQVNSNNDIIGKKCFDIFMKRNSPCPWCKLKEVFDEGISIEEYTNPEDLRELKTGRALKIMTNPIKNTLGEVIGAVEYAIDITEFREKENAIKRAKKMYQDLAEQSPIGIIACDIDGNITFANARVVELMESPSLEDTMSINLLTFPPLKSIGVSEQILHCMDNNKMNVSDVHYTSKWGKELWMKIYVNPLLNENQVEGARIVIDDITELVQKKQRFKENEKHFNIMVENLADAVWVIDRVGIIRNVNDKAASDTLYSKQELIGKNIESLDPTIKSGSFPLIFDQIIESGYVKYIGQHIRKDGETIDIEANAVTLEIDGEILDVCSTRNITEQKQYEKELKTAKEKAEEANMTKGSFLANMSHEIRTPMNGLMGILQLLETSELSQEQAELVEIAKKSSLSLLNVVNDILDYSRIESGKIYIQANEFYISELLEDTKKLFYPAAINKNIQLTAVIMDGVPEKASGDVYKIKQILNNLVGNAIKFTPKGEVRILVNKQYSQDERLFEIEFQVKDTGIGIPEDYISNIFDRFSQSDSSNTRQFGGTGLGLAICKGLIELMNGRIKVESQIGTGTIFSFILPLTKVENPSDITKKYDQTKLSTFSRCINILIVEDDEISSLIIKKIANKKGWASKVCKNGLEAVNLFSENVFDIIIMDVHMPELDGYEATKQIRQLESTGKTRTPIIAMTANAFSGDKEKCLKNGMDDYISKPIDFNEFNIILEKWVKWN